MYSKKIVKLFYIHLLFLTALSSWSETEEKFYFLVKKSTDPNFSDIVFCLRLPASANMKKQAHNNNKPVVRGVMAICSWQKKPNDIKQWISDKSKALELVNFAKKHNLALISWSNIKGYDKGLSTDDMSKPERIKYEKQYRRRAHEWEKGYKRFCKKYNLPSKNLLVYGVSGGAQTIHRLALRMPEHFFAIHMHINSSYDKITKKNNNVLWLVTTGTMEYGYSDSIRFYNEARKAGYYMIFRTEENLGHYNSPRTKKTSLAFFEYCLSFLPDPRDPKKKPSVKNGIYFMMRHPEFIGDHINGTVYKKSLALKHMEKKVMVPLPTKKIAEAWGVIFDK